MGRRFAGALAALCAAGFLTTLASSAHAEENEVLSQPEVVSLGLVFRRATYQPTLGSSNFTGHGTDGYGDDHSVNATGVQLGILRPKVNVYDFGFDLDVDAFHGGLFFGVGKTSSDAQAQISDIRRVLDVDDITIFRMGLELGSSYWIGDHLRLTAGGTIGFQLASMKLPGMVTRCGKNNSATCEASASAVIPWVQPRLAAEVLLGEKIGLGVGGYVATDIIRPQDIETGVTFSFRGLITNGKKRETEWW
jgi:hypothetical protein